MPNKEVEPDYVETIVYWTCPECKIENQTADTEGQDWDAVECKKCEEVFKVG